MYFPALLKVGGEPCLLVGGGAVALQKARALKKAGARIRVVAPKIGAALARLAEQAVRRAFRTGDIAGQSLVIAATDDPRVNRRVHAACRARRIPVNVVDVPELCSFIVPSVFRRGPVTVAISTGGLSPGLAKALRLRLEALLPASLGRLARELGRVRRRLPAGPARLRLLEKLTRERLRKEAAP